MKNINENLIKDEVKKLIYKACHILDKDVIDRIAECKNKEKNELAKSILEDILENDRLAENTSTPLCQDTGVSVFFVEIGNEVYIDGDINKAINDGVREAYKEYYLRKSICDPITRENTGDNTPAVIHYSITKGDKLVIKFAPKGAGSENMSKVKMLKPADQVEGIKKFVLETVKEAGGKCCPPVVVGIGIGGNLEKCAIMAKESLYNSLDYINEDEYLRGLEKEIMDELNNSNIGPMGLGGNATCLRVFIKKAPCHIASLPVAINIQCHQVRHSEVTL